MSTAPSRTAHPLLASIPADSVTSLTRNILLFGQLSRSIAALSDGRNRSPSSSNSSGTVAGGGQE